MNRKQRRRTQAARKASGPKDAQGRSKGLSAAALLARAGPLFEQGRAAEAAALCRRAVAAEPGNFAAQANLGNALMKMGAAEDAAAAFGRALAIDADSLPVLGNLATLKAETGDYAAATALYRHILALKPDDAETYHDLALIKSFAADDPDIAAMRRLGDQPSLGAEGRMFIDFALTKAYDQIGDTRRAFAAAEAANRAKRAGLDYDVARDEALVERIIAVFDRAFVDAVTAAGDGAGEGDETPVFIIGMPRSGTTLVEQIIASHSKAFGAGEVNHLRDVIMGFGGGRGTGKQATVAGFPEGARELGAGDFSRLGGEYVARLKAAAPDASRITDKMPRNFFFAGLIQIALPGARIIHCRRNPVATCWSCYQIHFPDGQDFTYDLGELGRYYRLYARLMDHWRALAPARFYDLRYEDLVSDPEARIRDLLDFLGLAWEDGCLAFHQAGRLVRTASAHQVRQPVYTSAIDKWRRYEAHLGPLIAALGDLAEG